MFDLAAVRSQFPALRAPGCLLRRPGWDADRPPFVEAHRELFDRKQCQPRRRFRYKPGIGRDPGAGARGDGRPAERQKRRERLSSAPI